MSSLFLSQLLAYTALYVAPIPASLVGPVDPTELRKRGITLLHSLFSSYGAISISVLHDWSSKNLLTGKYTDAGGVSWWTSLVSLATLFDL